MVVWEKVVDRHVFDGQVQRGSDSLDLKSDSRQKGGKRENVKRGNKITVRFCKGGDRADAVHLPYPQHIGN